MVNSSLPLDPSYPATLLRELLDRGYERAVAPVVNAISADVQPGGLLARRLIDLEQEARRLAAAGERLAPANPFWRAMMSDLTPALRRYAVGIDNTVGLVTADGIVRAEQFTRLITLRGLNDAQLGTLRIGFNRPDPEAIARLVDYTALPAWQDELRAYGPDVEEAINNIAIRGAVEGWGPLRTAETLAQRVEVMPLARANNLMRTLQIQSFRRAQTASAIANNDILSHKVRLSALDDRVCLACLALHGTILALNEEVDDHHQGRCFSVTVLKGDTRLYETGDLVWGSLDETRQQRLAGPANYQALESGAVTLRDYVQPYTDPVFGSMLREASLSGILGESAQQYYARNR